MAALFFVLRLTAAWFFGLTLLMVWIAETIGLHVHPGFVFAIGCLSWEGKLGRRGGHT